MNTFIGVDLAWQSDRNHTGIVVASGDTAGAEVTAVAVGLHRLEEVAAFITDHATDDCVVAIDAPLVLRNESGRRPCESLITRRFGYAHAGAHSSNLSLYPDAASVKLVAMLERAGFRHDLEMVSSGSRSGKWMFEVYPHPALVVLFERSKIFKYKKGNLAQKRFGLEELCASLKSLASVDPPLIAGAFESELFDSDLTSMSGTALKHYEDKLDAFVCSYLALHLWRWGAARNEMVGDLDTGYIVVPTIPVVSGGPQLVEKAVSTLGRIPQSRDKGKDVVRPPAATPSPSRNWRSVTTAPGFVNRNQQEVVRRTNAVGNLHGQNVYALRCGRCGAMYGANGCAVFQRKCPECQGGQPGLSVG